MNISYKTWNDAIGKYFFSPQRTGQRIFLTVDDETLWRISQDYGSRLQFASRDQAVQDFIAVVGDELRQRGWTFVEPQDGRYPLFLGFLALQVLAVFKMREDATWSAMAYWGRLCELLGDMKSYMPLGLKENRHQELWYQGLARWANKLQQGRLGVVSLPPPVPQGVNRNHVGLPKSQALLTSADLDHLPTFYHEARLNPGEDVEEAFLLGEVKRLLAKPAIFQRHAQRVLHDKDRAILACGQIREHLCKWDGDGPVGDARLWLQIKEGDPPELDGGLIVGDMVLPGIQLEDILGKVRYPYPPGKIFCPLHRPYYITVFNGEAWEERRHAKPGEGVLLLIPLQEVGQRYENVRQIAEEVERYHADSDGSLSSQDSIKLRGLPRGWCALKFHVREELPVSVPSWCRSWLYAPPLQLTGGLRIARQIWLPGAGPTILVRAPDVTTVYIDGCPYEIVERHVTPQQAPCLDQSGRHTIQIEGIALLQFILENRDILPEKLSAGWIFRDQEWPSPQWQLGPPDAPPMTGLCLQGPVVYGRVKPLTSAGVPIQRQWLELTMRMRGEKMGNRTSSQEQAEESLHPLISQMQKIVKKGGLSPP